MQKDGLAGNRNAMTQHGAGSTREGWSRETVENRLSERMRTGRCHDNICCMLFLKKLIFKNG